VNRRWFVSDLSTLKCALRDKSQISQMTITHHVARAHNAKIKIHQDCINKLTFEDMASKQVSMKQAQKQSTSL
jgi:hypothetical protein